MNHQLPSDVKVVNPGTLFIPACIINNETVHTHDEQSEPPTAESEPLTAESSNAEQPDTRIMIQLLKATAALSFTNTDADTMSFDEAVELFITNAQDYIRYGVYLSPVEHPIFGPGFIPVATQSTTALKDFIDDIVRSGPATVKMHGSIISAKATYNTQTGRVMTSTTVPWVEVIDHGSGQKYPSTTVIAVVDDGSLGGGHDVVILDTAPMVDEYLITHLMRQDTASSDAGAIQQQSTNTTEYDQLLAGIIRSVAAQIESTDLHTEVKDVTDDRAAAVATLTSAATMLEHQAQHSDSTITTMVIDNLTTLSHRAEAQVDVIDSHSESDPEYDPDDADRTEVVQMTLAEATSQAASRIRNFHNTVHF